MKRIAIIAIAAAALTACGEKSVEQVMKDSGQVAKSNAFTFQTVEEQRAQGRANAGASAAEYQRQNPRIQGWETIVKADTTHSSTFATKGSSTTRTGLLGYMFTANFQTV